MATSKTIIFTKDRIANIMSAVILVWGFMYFTQGVIIEANAHVPSSGSEVIAGIMGFAAKHLWDSCSK